MLIFDEVITGFRWSRGGAQARFGVTPDMCVLAKIVAGGLPGGAVAGRADIMDQLDRGRGQGGGTREDRPSGHVQRQPAVRGGGASRRSSIVEREDVCAQGRGDRRRRSAPGCGRS